MNYFDDILNVYAYMFSKSKKNAEKSQEMMKDIEELDKSFNNIQQHII